ncbi:MAG: 3-hydroxyacyl-ACP dehydratase FabZ [Kiritimatiellaeota bacterium]|nr:3-hydroxyacyl-ACP dehydratase FabZ [Kiritimatiellota bacterium]
MNQTGIERILQLLPHRYPFLLVDKIIESDGATRQVAIKNVTINEPFFQGHFPGYPVMPGVLQIEVIAQAAGIMALDYNEKNGVKNDFDTILMSIDSAKFRRIVRPGDQLRIETKIISHRRNMAKISGVITVDGETATEATLMFALLPKSARETPKTTGDAQQ